VGQDMLRLALSVPLIAIIGSSLVAQGARPNADATVADWVAANTTVVGHGPGVRSIYITRAVSLDACRMTLNTTDSSQAGQIQFVSEKTMDVEYRQLDAEPGIVRLDDIWLVHVKTLPGQDVAVRTRMVIQGEVWARSTRTTFVELIAPTRASADTLGALVRDVVTACKAPVQVASGTEKNGYF